MMGRSLWKILLVLLLSIQQSFGYNPRNRSEPHIARYLPPDYPPKRPYIYPNFDGPDISKTTPRVTEITSTSTSAPRLQYYQCEELPIKLDFTRVGLKSIGNNFVVSSKVTEMYLGYNAAIHVSPFLFSSLPNLKLLDLSGNNITIEKALEFDGHNRLQKLIIDDNICKEFDTKLERYTNPLPILQELSLRRNCISNFAVNLKTFAPQLTRLHLSGNRIDSTEFLDNLPSTLSHLYVDDNLIPYVKGDVLKTVEDLSVSKNKIQELCGASCDNSNSLALNEAIKLHKLNASHNEVSEVKEDAFASTKHLTQLDLSGNKIMVLPDKIFEGLTSLKELYLSQNGLTVIPNVCPLSRMKLLDLSSNRIGAIVNTNFCSQFMHLETLVLANNGMNNIDSDAFRNLQSLQKLDLSNNLITILPANLITAATSLRVLSLKNNSIAKLDEIYMAQSESLHELHLQDNPLLHLKVAWIFPTNLRNLVIHLKDLPLNNDRAADDDKEEDEDNKDDNNWLTD